MIPMSVAVGDKVLVPEYGGTKLTFDNEVKIVCAYVCVAPYPVCC